MLLAGGIGQPYVTTDYPAVQRALELDADAPPVAKRGVDGVYDSDRHLNPDAVRYTRLTYDEALAAGVRIMDTSAFVLANEQALTMHVFDVAAAGVMREICEGAELGTGSASSNCCPRHHRYSRTHLVSQNFRRGAKSARAAGGEKGWGGGEGEWGIVLYPRDFSSLATAPTTFLSYPTASAELHSGSVVRRMGRALGKSPDTAGQVWCVQLMGRERLAGAWLSEPGGQKPGARPGPGRLSAAEADRGALVMLRGDAGIGKTRLG